MASELKIVKVEKLQEKINETVKSFADTPGLYVSLNKTQKSVEQIFKDSNISTKKIFFIDCVTSKVSRKDVLHISPSELEMLGCAIDDFMGNIKGEKFLIIDALSTLLIYNNEDSVARFVRKVTEHSCDNQVKIVALSPQTKGEELLKKIFNFFDTVTGKWHNEK
jgi:archaellum biogenesis ATPase FlaH